MTAIAFIFWRICLFKTGPEVVPANNFLLGSLITLNILVSWLASIVLQAILPISPEATSQISDQELTALTDVSLLITRIVVSLASTAGLIWGVLAIMNFSSRVNKVLCAVFGTDIILTVATTLAVFVGQAVHPMLGQFAILAMFFWTLATMGFILHRALAISLGFGIAAALFVLIFSFAIGQVAVV